MDKQKPVASDARPQLFARGTGFASWSVLHAIEITAMPGGIKE
jgi:hypothetical protein